jgi:hypothetical protein
VKNHHKIRSRSTPKNWDIRQNNRKIPHERAVLTSTNKLMTGQFLSNRQLFLSCQPKASFHLVFTS